MQQTTLVLLSVALLATACTDKRNDNNTTVQNPPSSKEIISKKTTKTKNYFTKCDSKMAFSRMIRGLSHDEEDSFILGRSFFTIPWVEAPSATTARDGLGPLFSANTCIHCHPKHGAGVAVNKDGKMNRTYLLRLSHKESNDTQTLKTVGFKPDSTYGAQLSITGNMNVPFEGKAIVTYETIEGKYPDGTVYTLRKPHYTVKSMNYGEFDKETILAGRIGSALVGLGQLEAISEEDILAYEDVEDRDGDGISGKANYAFDPETNTTKLGRFTWKASAVSVKHQSAGAAHNDMGLSNPLFPQHNCTDKQKKCQEEAAKARHALDLPALRLDAITFFLSNLAIPRQREPEKHLEGKKIFESLDCTSCHVPSYKTASGITIQPYTDLLLHDMGEGLADGRSEFLATGSEWRTAPLWGKGLQEKVAKEANFLHDGRARSIEEAILWHGGEAQKSKEGFMALDKISREKVLEFLHSI